MFIGALLIYILPGTSLCIAALFRPYEVLALMSGGLGGTRLSNGEQHIRMQECMRFHIRPNGS